MDLKKLKNKLFRRPGQRAVIAVPYIWLLILFLIPFAIVLKISFAEQEIAIPPFTPLTTIDEDLGRLNIAISYQNYADIFQNFWNTLNPFGDSENSNIYLMTYWSSIKTALTDDHHLPVDWLSDRLCHFTRQSGCAQRPAVGNHAAFLDLFPAACLRMDGLIGSQRHHQ